MGMASQERGALIYGLCEPDTGALRYVGMTSRTLEWRVNAHMRPSQLCEQTHKACWLRSLVEKGLGPDFFVIEEHSSIQLAMEAERFWIQYFRGLGCDLANLTDGGEGMWGFKFSEESKRRMSEKRKGKPFPAFDRAKWLLTRRRKPVVDSTGVVHPSVRQAAITMGVSKGNLTVALKRGTRCGGRYWKWL